MKYDLFISHASEDKETLVRPLAVALQKLSIEVWYDEFTLTVGDSLSKSIDLGLINSQFGLIVLSKDFFAKKWPDYELRSLLSKEIAYDKVILPIWHGITKDDLLTFSPYLADKYALNSENSSIEELALDICKAVKPNVYENLTRTMIYEALYENSSKKQTNKIEVKDLINSFPIRHESLPIELINRIKITNKVLQDVFHFSLEETIEDFKHDTNPAREVAIWEAIASTYIDLLNKIDDKEEYKNYLGGLLLHISLTNNKEETYKKFNMFPKKIINKAYVLFANNSSVKNTHLVAIKR
ncbi:toll/interleukin-1 receptor domain-containing protein [Anaeromicropila herbilytica]|uniref:TIR domain-containing protein n=1 Tax=Anaeromicropila herbilytica TaxID=2785025 RepID=A0A7R7EHU1_9FIRM|nr:toll/interleukin-1 receptor domain-containing protein [Anaeromicropila herbilytica]BCN29004.1 hypothetical protein bsdtb5_02990 [Anaeromicropila herbilytica]